jgi:hypothetical protein
MQLMIFSKVNSIMSNTSPMHAILTGPLAPMVLVTQPDRHSAAQHLKHSWSVDPKHPAILAPIRDSDNEQKQHA